MGYAQIDICEVGPAEYPLINVLRDTIFSEHNHVYRTPFETMVEGRADLLCLIAHLEGNPVGYKVGFRDRPGVFYSYSGGVLKDYRRMGVAARLQDWQHSAIRARGYKSVYFSSFNKFRSMLRFGLSTGFVPVGVEERQEGELSFKFVKDLTLPESAQAAQPAEMGLQLEAVDYPQLGKAAELLSSHGASDRMTAWERRLSKSGSVAVISLLNRAAVGVAAAAASQDEEGAFELVCLAVEPARRRRGIGVNTLGRLVDEVARTRGRVIRAACANTEVGMIGTALAAGFNITGLIHRSGEVAKVEMELPTRKG